MPVLNIVIFTGNMQIHGVPDGFDDLDDIMNGIIRDKLEIIPEDVIWGGKYQV